MDGNGFVVESFLLFLLLGCCCRREAVCVKITLGGMKSERNVKVKSPMNEMN